MDTLPDLFPGFRSARIEGDGAAVFCRIGGEGPPVLLLHGFPQTHAMWHRIAPALASRFSLVIADLRGYGASDTPADDAGHTTYSKRTMARDLIAVMNRLGHSRFAVVGHDRGARVAYRMALDTPQAVERLAVLDILPTAVYWDRLGHAFGLAIYHWMFLAQPAPLPERLIGGSGEFFCDYTLSSWTKNRDLSAFDPGALVHYRALFHDPARIAAMCADYRAGAGPDVDADNTDRAVGKRIAPSLLALWGTAGLAASGGTPLEVWSEWAADARGAGIDSGHFIPEENPDATVAALLPFLNGA